MLTTWQWTGRYVAVIIVAVVLAMALGSMDLFESTTLGKKITAANIVEVLGYGTALAVLWRLGQRAALTFREQDNRWSFVQYIVPPLVTLIVVASAHGVVLILLRGLMDAEQKNLYNWLFIIGIVASAAWLLAALFRQSSPLSEAVSSAAQRISPAMNQSSCSNCGAPTEAEAKFCSECGQPLRS